MSAVGAFLVVETHGEENPITSCAAFCLSLPFLSFSLSPSFYYFLLQLCFISFYILLCMMSPSLLVFPLSSVNSTSFPSICLPRVNLVIIAGFQADQAHVQYLTHKYINDQNRAMGTWTQRTSRFQHVGASRSITSPAEKFLKILGGHKGRPNHGPERTVLHSIHNPPCGVCAHAHIG